MKTLVLMRHAKSDWSHPGLPDHERPLNRRGERAAAAMGSYLENSQVSVQRIVASTAVRVQQTLRLMQQTWRGLNAEIITDGRLYLASPETVQRVALEHLAECDSVMIVGHNPAIEQVHWALTNQEVHFPTAAVSIFVENSRFGENNQESKGWLLVDFRRPRDLEN
jgi:phosphohistidine phosphatase